MMMREFVEMRANNDPHFPRRISNEPLCSKLNLCLTLFPGTIPGSYTRAVINVLLFLRNFFKVNSLKVARIGTASTAQAEGYKLPIRESTAATNRKPLTCTHCAGDTVCKT